MRSRSTSHKKGIKDIFLFEIKASIVSNLTAASMVFKKSFAALVLALPLVLGISIFFSKNVDGLTMIAASPSHVRSSACDPLEAIKTDLLNNFFDNECGDTVSFFFSLLRAFI